MLAIDQDSSDNYDNKGSK